MPGPLSPAELEHVLRAHGLPWRDGQAAPAITARVLHVPALDGGFAIKVFGPEQRARARAEAALLRHLGTEPLTDVGVQQRVPPSSGELLLALDERLVLVTRWQAGAHRSYQAIDADGWEGLGRAMAELHLRLDQAPWLPLPSLMADLRARNLEADRRLIDEHRRHVEASGRPDAELVAQLLGDRSVLLDRHAERSQATPPSADDRPIHNDYNVHNFLFHADGPPTILDWERSIFAPREFELCRCLGHLPLVAPSHAWALVEGYLQRRSLRPALVRWALDVAVSVHALKHWPVEQWLAREPGSEERIPALAEIVRALAEQAAELEAFGAELEARTRVQEAP
ncbi:phosphotransferase enzyme family protein [Paraliomyxa miuraensis]|uniref:phosphotransferase enzyme family protein n=1 Tax=Paraliomyxa miuraensis TaxID=376150 RepID=UPI00224E4B03|nr:phosphotransferase [Paraliomyxa miuraensis]MCX4240439.1 phosphotransferase [Paraliomyxa miuraensis]